MRQSELDDYQYSGEYPWRDEELLRELFVERDLTAEKVGGLLGCNRATVYNWLPEDVLNTDKGKKGLPETPPELLREMYLDRGMSLRNMEEELGVSDAQLNVRLRRAGIETRDNIDWARRVGAQYRISNRGYPEWQVSGPGGTIVRVHALLAIANGEDPYKVFGGEYATHHKNGCKFDNRPENIELLTHGEHATLHNKINSGKEKYEDD